MCRKAKILLISSLVLFLALSCATSIKDKNADGSPVWTQEIPKSNKLIYGVGKAKLTSTTTSQLAADANARADLARRLEVRLREVTSVYSNEAEEKTRDAYEQILMQVVNLTIKGITVEQHYVAPDGTCWSLVSLSKNKISEVYSESVNTYKNNNRESVSIDFEKEV